MDFKSLPVEGIVVPTGAAAPCMIGGNCGCGCGSEVGGGSGS